MHQNDATQPRNNTSHKTTGRTSEDDERGKDSVVTKRMVTPQKNRK